MKLTHVYAALVLGALTLPLVAHDFWIEPDTFRPTQAAPFKIVLKVGDWGIGDDVPRNDARIEDFSIRGPGVAKSIVGRDGATPAGFARVESEGTYVLGYRSNHATVELDAAKFADYLRERGLESVLAQRERLGEQELKAREIFSRCAKSIVRVGQGSTGGFDTVLGYPLELIPEKNPSALAWVEREGAPAALESLSVRLYYDGKPLEHALVGALDLDAPRAADGSHQAPLTARTDGEGRVRFELPHGGRWLLAAVHMIRAEGHPAAEWESFWASLTFEAPKA